jgi:hypothetical protein
MKTKTRQLSAIPTAVLLSALCYLLFQHGLFWIAFRIFALVSLCATAIIVVALGLTSLMDRADARARARSTHTLPLRPTVSYSENPSSRHDRSTSDPAALNVGATETVRAQPPFFQWVQAPPATASPARTL